MTAPLSPFVWTAALTASVAAHASAAALVMAMLEPKAVPDQPPPQSELRIETQEVARSKATEDQPQATAAAAASSKGAATSEGVVPSSKAAVAAPQSQTLSAKPTPPASKAEAPRAQKLAPVAAPDALAAASVPAQKLAAAPPPGVRKPTTMVAQKLAVSTSPAVALTAQRMQTPTLQASAPVTAALPASAQVPDTLAALDPPAPVLASVAFAFPGTKAVPPDATQLAAATDTATPLPTATPDAPAAAQSQPNVQLAAAAPADGQHMTAALAWTGEDAQIDPASLKAIQSFMQPGDTAAQSDETHDALSAILTSVPCSRLQAEFNPATGALDLRGHVPDPALKGPVLAALQAQLGTGIKVNDAMLILPRPQCGALSGIADVGLPQSQDQNTNPRLIGADAQARAYDYTRGQTLVLDLAAPDYDAYVYVDYFAADGSVIHLIPNDTVALKLRPAKSALRVGAPDADEPFLNITIGPPYGQEIAAAFAASAPLYDGTRPLSEPAAAYLDWLKTRVTEARARDPEFKGEWVYFFVSTTDK